MEGKSIKMGKEGLKRRRLEGKRMDIKRVNNVLGRGKLKILNKGHKDQGLNLLISKMEAENTKIRRKTYLAMKLKRILERMPKTMDKKTLNR